MANSAVAGDLLRSLRHQIAKIEGVLPERLVDGSRLEADIVKRWGGCPDNVLATGAARFDAALGGGVPTSGLIEIHGDATRDAGALAGFAIGLASLTVRRGGMFIWIGTREIFSQAGRPYAPGLAQRFGIRPENLLIAEAENLNDVLWIAEEAANVKALTAVLLEVRGFTQFINLTATRRLHRRALEASHPLFLMRQAGISEPTAAPVRLVVTPAVSGRRSTLTGPLEGSIGPPTFQVSIDKNRASPPATFTLEWNKNARAFEERDHVPAAKNIVALAAADSDGTNIPSPLRSIVALSQTEKRTTSGGQPAGGQYTTHRRAGRAR